MTRPIPIPIAFILPDLGGGGAQTVMLQIAGGLDRDLFAARLLVLGGAQAFATQVPAHIEVEYGGAARVREGLPWLVRHLRARRPTVAVSVMGYLNLALLGASRLLRGTSLVVREANVLSATTSALPRWLPAHRLYARLYPRAAAIVSPTAPIAEEIVRLAPGARARIQIIPNPVDADGLRARALHPVRHPGEGLRIVSAGRLTRQKGYDRLIELVPTLPPDAHVTIYGDGPDRTALEERIASLKLANRVALPGFTRELPAAIAGADVFVLPSRWEGLPNVVLESLALGTPVIASEETAVAEVADAAPPGAVAIRAVNDAFCSAIRSVDSCGWTIDGGPRPSLLPSPYAKDAVILRWQTLLADVTRRADDHAPPTLTHRRLETSPKPSRISAAKRRR